MSLTLAGKRRPELSQFLVSIEAGIEYYELYLEERHLDQIENTLQEIAHAKREASARKLHFEIVSLHTPHTSNVQYLYQSIELAKRLDCWVVLHTNGIRENLGDLVKTEYPKVCVENRLHQDMSWLEENVLAKGKFLCLDNAHLYISTDNYAEEMNNLLAKYRDKIKVIHLNGSTKTKDGLSVSEGDATVASTAAEKIRLSNYEGIVIVETPLDTQIEDFKKVSSWLRKEEHESTQ